MPPPAREVELVLELSPGDLPYLQRHPRIRRLAVGRAVTRVLRSVYYDTPDLDLHRHKMGLRLRRVGDARVQTLKTEEEGGATLFDRGEFESPVAGDAPDLDALPAPALRQRLRRELSGKTLEPVFETETRRTTRLLRDGDDELALDVDVGVARTAGASAPICEVELELRAGDPARLFALALELQESIDLWPRSESKAALGYGLLTGRRHRARKARPVVFPRSPTLAEALTAIVGSCLDQIVANGAAAFEGRDIEGVHQLRVGVRRLRSALSVFRSVLPEADTVAFRNELRWLGQELGPARDLDVFLDECLGPILAAHPDDAGLARLRDVALERRARIQGDVRVAIHSRRHARLVLELGYWRTREPWSQRSPGSEPLLLRPAEVFADRLLARRHRRVRRRGRGLGHATIAEKHALRIELKKLRYAAEFFRDLYPRAATRRYLKRVVALQEILGTLNDVAAAGRVLDDLVAQAPDEPELRRAAGFVAGWSEHASVERQKRLRARWKAFKKTPPFWGRG